MRAILLFLLLTGGSAHAQNRVAFFGLTLLDSSLQTATQGDNAAEQARIAALETLIADRFAAEGYVLVDLEPQRQQIERRVNLTKCYGCEIRIANALGADYALVGEVQKVSNLILTMNLQLRDAASGQTMRGGVVDIRGNTDESWTRGMRYILKNRIFKKEN